MSDHQFSDYVEHVQHANDLRHWFMGLPALPVLLTLIIRDFTDLRTRKKAIYTTLSLIVILPIFTLVVILATAFLTPVGGILVAGLLSFLIFKYLRGIWDNEVPQLLRNTVAHSNASKQGMKAVLFSIFFMVILLPIFVIIVMLSWVALSPVASMAIGTLLAFGAMELLRKLKIIK